MIAKCVSNDPPIRLESNWWNGSIGIGKKIIKKKTKKTRKPDSDTEIREIDRSDDIGLVAEMELKPAGKSGDLLTG